MTKWLFSKRNIAACAVASIGTLLFLFGFIDKFWWLIVAGLYLSTYFIMPKEKEFDVAFQSDYTEFFTPSYDKLVDLIATHKSQVPSEVNQKLDNLLLNLKDLHSFFQKSKYMVMPSEELYSIKNIFEKYLPSMIEQYTQLPASYSNKVVVKDGKTTKDYLIEQLALLDTQFEKMAHSVYSNDAQSLLTNGQFLKQKFAKNEWDDIFASSTGTNTETMSAGKS